MKYFLTLILGFSWGFGQSQETLICDHSISGTLIDAKTTEPLAFAQVFILELGIGTLTDSKGRYNIENLCSGAYTLRCSHLNCEHQEIPIEVMDHLEQDVVLQHKELELDVISIFAEKLPAATTQSVMKLAGREFNSVKGKSLGKTLKDLPGLNSLNTGATISKPIIHGLHSNRILILNNGIRLEGQQWGSEHAPEIDPFIATQLTVIKGASSVRYGSGAIAGVILVEPSELKEELGLGGEINLVGFSNGRQGVVSGILEGKSGFAPLWSWRVQGTYKRGGNLRTPNYFLDNTGVVEDNFSISFGYKNQMSGSEVFASRFHTKLGILSAAHLGGSSDLALALESPEPLGADTTSFSYKINRPYQDVTHYLAKWKGFQRLSDGSKLSATYAFQHNTRLEFDKHRPRGTNADGEDIAELNFRIFTHTLEGVWEYGKANGFSGSTGLFGLYQNNRVKGRAFIPNFVTMGGEAFSIARWKNLRWELEGGIRYDYRWVHSAREENGIDIFSIQTYQNASGTLGAKYTFSPELSIQTNIGTAWRPPNVSELFSDGLHHGAAALQYGDSTLQSEQSFKWISSLSFSLDQKLTGELSVFYQRFRNFIFLEPEGIEQTIRGAFPAFQYTQAPARLIGADFHVNYTFAKHWQTGFKSSWLMADNLATDEPLIFMPANWVEGQLTHEWEPNIHFGETFITLKGRQVMKQNRVPENQDFLPPPEGYFLLSLDAGTEWKSGDYLISIGVSVDNLLNVTYRDYLNRFRYYSDEIGRNTSLRLTCKF